MKARPIALLLLLLLPALPAAAQERVAVPISQVALPDGDIRYTVPLSIGGAPPIPALLDTGSTGLRLLTTNGGSFYYQDTGAPSTYIYGSGEQLGGTVGLATIGIGAAITNAPIALELVSHIGCMAFQPECAATLPLQTYGIGGDGIAGQGFRAILGIGLLPAAAGDTGNPLPATGAQRWIIELPLPAASAPGTLILNPDVSELQDYQPFPLARFGNRAGPATWLDTLPACLSDASNGQKLCGPALLDTGAPGIIAYQPGATEAPLWSPGDATTLQLGNPGDTSVSLAFTADRSFGSGLLQAPPNGGPAIVAGVLPFFAYDVLYDAAAGSIGLKPRADAPDFIAAPAPASPAAEIEVIQINTPHAAAAASALPPVYGPPP